MYYTESSLSFKSGNVLAQKAIVYKLESIWAV